MRIDKCVISAALLVIAMVIDNLYAGTIAFPAGTQVHLVGITHNVAQDGIGFIM